MHAKEKLNKWEWKEGTVDRTEAHLRLYCGEWGESALLLALVSKPVENSFTVEFLEVQNISQTEREQIKAEVTKELNYYLVGLGEPDPWKYAIYHCGTAANVYSFIHWAYFPKGDSGNDQCGKN